MNRRRTATVATLSLALSGAAAVGAPAVSAAASAASASSASSASSVASAASASVVAAGPGARPAPAKHAVARGRGGAVSSVDPEATRIGLRVLRRGGNAVDAAVATAAALGVTEPYSAGIGGGGYLVTYQARTGRVRVVDGRETAPKRMPNDAFVDPDTGALYPFTPERVTSGVSVGVPGTPATWTTALRRFGSIGLARALAPAERLARRGFVVDETFRSQTEDNRDRFAAFSSTRALFLRGGVLPEVGSLFRNPDLADTYAGLARGGDEFFYGDGRLPREIVRAVRNPPVLRDSDLPVPPGFLRTRDLADYRALVQDPTRSDYRGYDVRGMSPSSSGGTTVGEALDILEQLDLTGLDDAEVLHRYLEASALAFADRGAYVGDEAFVDVPTRVLLSDTFAAERACLIDPEVAAAKPVAAGDVTDYDGTCDPGLAPGAGEETAGTEGPETSHLTVVDRRGNVVSYTLTIEQTGGSGIVVPGRGFLLNNELTDFSGAYDPADPNRIQPGKRPRSSMSPTILLRDGRPVLALGSPGGSTIITTVLQTLLNRLDLGMSLPQALAAPRASQRNTASVTAEPAFVDAYGPALEAYGHTVTRSGDEFTSAAEIGALTGIQIGPGGLLTAVAEPTRRGGGDARVVRARR